MPSDEIGQTPKLTSASSRSSSSALSAPQSAAARTPPPMQSTSGTHPGPLPLEAGRGGWAERHPLLDGALLLREPGVKAGLGVAGRHVLQRHVPLVTALVDRLQHVRVVDLAGAGLVAPGHVRD